MSTIYTAIIGKYDDLKEPFVKNPDWRHVCFTDQDLKSDTWEIVRVKVRPEGPAKTARHIKIMFHEYIQDEFSMWIDGTFFINCDLNQWWKQFREPFTTVFHPFDRCIYTDITSCMQAGKGDANVLNEQSKVYRQAGLPESNGLISSGILMRQNMPEVQKFCSLWYKEVLTYTERDQIAFGFANWVMPDMHQSITWDYTWQKEFIHIPHLHKIWRFGKLNEVMSQYGSNKTS